MSATKYFPVGTIFGLQDGMSQAQIKALEWMYSVKTTTKSAQANLESFWENGSMMFKSNKTIRRGDKFVLLEDDAVKSSPKKKASNDESDSEQEISEETDSPSKNQRPTRKSSRTTKSNKKYCQTDEENSGEDNSDEDVKEEDLVDDKSDESLDSSAEVRSSRRKIVSRNKSYKEPKSESESEEEGTRNTGDEEERFSCNTCSKVFSNAPALKEHKKKHGPAIKMHKCDHCNRSFVYVTSLEAHLKEEHKIKSTKDDEKRKKGSPKEASKKDEEKPSKKTPQKMYKCDDCGKEFRWETSYDDHRAVHRKDFVCKICKKVFGKKIFLENHAITHKKDKNKRGKDGEKVADVVDVSSDEEKAEESESEQPKLGRGKRERKIVSPRSPVDRNRRENAKRINYSMRDEDSEDEAALKPKKRAKIDSDSPVRSCYVKLERLSQETKSDEVGSDGEESEDEDYKCHKCEKVYKTEMQWLNHMKKNHSRKS